MDIILTSGRKVYLGEIHQSRTYAGVLAGKPNEWTNKSRIRELLEAAQKFTVAGGTPLLIDPDPATVSSSLPAITCIAVLESGELRRPGSEPYSSLTAVWFQETFALPIDASIQERIRATDWEKHAKDWIW